MHVYMVEQWRRVPILLNLSWVINGVMINNLTLQIVQNLVEFGRMNKMDVANKLICFGTNGVTIL